MENSGKPLPPFFIGKKLSNIRKEIYIRRKYPLLCKELDREDTRSIWYSKEHIEQLLEEIRHVNGNGMWFHFAAYEQGHQFDGQLCIVMNSTRSDSDGRRSTVYIEDEPDFEDRRQATPDKGTLTDLNFGSPCPPRCD